MEILYQKFAMIFQQIISKNLSVSSINIQKIFKLLAILMKNIKMQYVSLIFFVSECMLINTQVIDQN